MNAPAPLRGDEDCEQKSAAPGALSSTGLRLQRLRLLQASTGLKELSQLVGRVDPSTLTGEGIYDFGHPVIRIVLVPEEFKDSFLPLLDALCHWCLQRVITGPQPCYRSG
jgi:hypothetical protein